MSRSFVASILCLLAIVTLASCSSEVAPEAELQGPGLSNVVTENASAKSVNVDAAGGVITTTASNGAVYSLTIPPEAVDSSVRIRMYPITSITGYPLASNVAAGVHLEPEGLAPTVPLTLTIDLPSNVDMSTLVPLASKQNATGTHAYPAIISGRRVTFTLTHFSQYTTGNATLDELLRMQSMQGIVSERFQNELALLYINAQRSNQTPQASEYRRIINDWYTQVLAPLFTRFTAASTFDDVVLSTVFLRDEYNAWLAAINFCVATVQGSFDVSSLFDESQSRASEAMLNGLIVINDECVQLAGSDPNGPADAVVVKMAERAGIALTLNAMARSWNIDRSGLDLASVLNGLPIKVAIVSRTVPESFKPGAIGNLDVRAGVKILDRAVRTSPPVIVTLSNVVRGSASPMSGHTDAAGKFSSTLQWLSDGDFSVDVVASLSTSLGIPYAARVRVFDRLTVRHLQNTARVGSWKKLDHAWIDQDGAENTNGLIVKTTASSHLFVYNPFGGRTLVFDIPIAWSGDSFTGNGVIASGSAFEGWNATASGTIRSDSTLQFTWSIAGTGQSWRGSDVFPPGE